MERKASFKSIDQKFSERLMQVKQHDPDKEELGHGFINIKETNDFPKPALDRGVSVFGRSNRTLRTGVPLLVELGAAPRPHPPPCQPSSLCPSWLFPTR